ncbi:MAG: hypothetical protein JNK05_31735 [Myxococcales bacterium]|nr:hypothetical protein [Myxococcales bacterium]
MKSFVAITLALALPIAGCQGDPRPYNNHDLALLTSYAAKEMCSCIFVMKKDEPFCLRFTRASPNLRTVRVNYEQRYVDAFAVLAWGARARYLSQREGCRLEQ